MDLETHDKYVDMIRPGSGCEFAKDFNVFRVIFKLTNGNPCKGCGDSSGCEFLKKTMVKIVGHEGVRRLLGRKTNAELAKELGVSKRQIAKMRKRGEIR